MHFFHSKYDQEQLLKGLIHPKMIICCKCTPQAVQDVNEFICLPEQIWRNSALHHLTNGSSAVNGCRQNDEFKQLIKTSTRCFNPQETLTTLVHQLISLSEKLCVCKKQVHQ